MRGAGRVALGLAIGLGIFAAFASAAIWALVLLASLPWQILAVAVACCALLAFARWWSGRKVRAAQLRSAAALRMVSGEPSRCARCAPPPSSTPPTSRKSTHGPPPSRAPRRRATRSRALLAYGRVQALTLHAESLRVLAALALEGGR